MRHCRPPGEKPAKWLIALRLKGPLPPPHPHTLRMHALCSRCRAAAAHSCAPRPPRSSWPRSGRQPALVVAAQQLEAREWPSARFRAGECHSSLRTMLLPHTNVRGCRTARVCARLQSGKVEEQRHLASGSAAAGKRVDRHEPGSFRVLHAFRRALVQSEAHTEGSRNAWLSAHRSGASWSEEAGGEAERDVRALGMLLERS